MSLTESLASSFGLAHADNVKTAIEKSPQNKDIFIHNSHYFIKLTRLLYYEISLEIIRNLDFKPFLML